MQGTVPFARVQRSTEEDTATPLYGYAGDIVPPLYGYGALNLTPMVNALHPTPSYIAN